MSKRQAPHIDAIDKAVGSRLRLRRMQLGISQQVLAGKLDITYQQLQKNEGGLNRIGAGRLLQLAEILGVTVSYFFLDVAPVDGEERSDVLAVPVPKFDHECLQLMQAYDRIRDKHVKKRIIALIDGLAEKGDAQAVKPPLP